MANSKKDRSHVEFVTLWWGDKYSHRYVSNLGRELRAQGQSLTVLTNRPDEVNPAFSPIDITAYDLPKWWGKMLFFNSSLFHCRRIFLDLDTAIVGDLIPLTEWSEGDFGICRNFTQLAGHKKWPCRYGSCVMAASENYGWHIWLQFWNERQKFMDECKYGDQQAIEMLEPNAEYLQHWMPRDFFVGYRELTDDKPENAALVIFAGSNTPEKCKIGWVREHWRK